MKQLKLMSAIFMNFYFFTKGFSPKSFHHFFFQNHRKFHQKSSFCSRDIELFLYFSFSVPCFPDSKEQLEVEQFMI